MFRFDYSCEFLKWALTPPGWHTDWHCAVRVASSKKMVGFISAIPAKIDVKGTATDMVEINFLCVHKKLRSKRVAPTLIREITRRVNQKGIFQCLLHCRCCNPETGWNSKISSQEFKSKETCCHSIHISWKDPDDEPDDASNESSRSNKYTRP